MDVWKLTGSTQQGKWLRVDDPECSLPSVWAWPVREKPICFAFAWGPLWERGAVVGFYLICELAHLPLRCAHP